MQPRMFKHCEIGLELITRSLCPEILSPNGVSSKAGDPELQKHILPWFSAHSPPVTGLYKEIKNSHCKGFIFSKTSTN